MSEERKNFHRMPTEHMVLWWVDAGHKPDLAEAYEKLMLLRETGASPKAFSFALPFDEKGRAIRSQFPKKDCA